MEDKGKGGSGTGSRIDTEVRVRCSVVEVVLPRGEVENGRHSFA